MAREDLFVMRMPFVDVRENLQDGNVSFRQFTLFMTRDQVELLTHLVQDLQELLTTACHEPAQEAQEDLDGGI